MPEDIFAGMTQLDWDVNHVINGVRKADDHSAVLITASFISELLRKLIEARLLCNSGTERLFSGPTAPAQTFSARSYLALALGLITDDEHRRVTIVRRIRNLLAHEFKMSFLDDPVATKCFLFDPKAKVPSVDGRYASRRARADVAREEYLKHALSLCLLFWIRLKDKKLEHLTSIVAPPASSRKTRKTKAPKARKK
jgi:hypothetical protein